MAPVPALASVWPWRPGITTLTLRRGHIHECAQHADAQAAAAHLLGDEGDHVRVAGLPTLHRRPMYASICWLTEQPHASYQQQHTGTIHTHKHR
jgi:hypothetical protein